MERKVLGEIQETIEINNVLSLDHIQVIEDLQSASDTIISIIENDNYNSDISRLTYESAFRSGTNIYLSHAGYEELKNAGFDIIQSDLVKSEIIKLFDVEYVNQKEFIDFMRANQPVYEAYMVDNFNSYSDGIEPIDKIQLLNDPKCLSLFRRIKWRRSNIVNDLLRRIADGERVTKLIKDELGE